VTAWIQTLALTAALVAVVSGLAEGYGALVTLKRAVIGYLAFAIVGSLVGLVFRLGVEDDWIREAWQRHQEWQRQREEKRRREREKRQQEQAAQAEQERRQREQAAAASGTETTEAAAAAPPEKATV